MRQEEKAGAPATPLQTKAERTQEACLAEYVRAAKEDIQVLREVNWDSPQWKRVGLFAKQSALTRGRPSKIIDPADSLHPSFIDFAKAYIRERHLQNPGESYCCHSRRLQALRMVEAALADLHGSGDPLKIDIAALDKAAALAGICFNKSTPHNVGRELEVLADVLARHGIGSGELGQWRSPLKQPRNMGYTVGSEGDKARREKLPSSTALEALAEVFCRDLDPSDDRCQRDIYTTSVTVLLLCAPSRGQEVHRLPVSLVFEATDRFGQEQMGLRLHASKGFGAYVKWVWSEMVPVAQKALERMKAITEAGRSLARHLEDPKTREHFYRHANCPAVGEDEPLTAAQVCLALGRSTEYLYLNRIGLSSIYGANTLRSLWTDWVLPRHREAHPHFPWLSARDKALGGKGGLKYSEALFCMLANQLHGAKGTSPVLLWMPALSSAYTPDVAMSIRSRVNIFDRYGHTDSDGQPLKLTSHQIRHLLNTEAQRMGLSQEQIAHWSGRKDVRQNAVYDHRPEQERVDQARPWVAGDESLPGPWVPTGEDGPQSRQDGHWRIDAGHKPRSCRDLENIQPRLSGLKTEYGECHHDWALAPCEGFVECLDCSEHRCIKGCDADAQEKLQRLQALHRQVLGAWAAEFSEATRRAGIQALPRYRSERGLGCV